VEERLQAEGTAANPIHHMMLCKRMLASCEVCSSCVRTCIP
jgi:hypothetical protein